jgi:hypothetical protein
MNIPAQFFRLDAGCIAVRPKSVNHGEDALGHRDVGEIGSKMVGIGDRGKRRMADATAFVRILRLSAANRDGHALGF